MGATEHNDRATTATSIEPVIVVSEGLGKTANIEGAKAKEVHNVSNPRYHSEGGWYRILSRSWG
jgi:hypothetical protein